MPFRLALYRAPDGLGPMHTWEREHRAPLGSRAQLRSALDALLPALRWEASDALLLASGPFGAEEHAVEITLFGTAADALLDISVYARPPAVRAIMSRLALNYCYAQESGQLYWPFEAGEHWPGSPR